MDEKENKFNLENDKYVDKLLQMLENGEFSDIDDMEESEDRVDEDERVRKERKGEKIVDSRECRILEENNNINESVKIQNTEPTTKGFQNKKIVRWRKQTPDIPSFEWIESDKIGDFDVLDPIQYFSKYITDEIFE